MSRSTPTGPVKSDNTAGLRLAGGRATKAALFTESTDLELLEAVAGGGQNAEPAFAELMRRKTEPLLALTYRIVGDREEAKDLVQLTFLRVWEKRRHFNPRWSPNTWLYRIATNLAIDLFRAKKTRHGKIEPVRHHLYRVVRGGSRSSLEPLLEREALAVLQDLSSGLSEKQRLAFVLRELEGLSTRDVAEVMGCRESTVRNHLFTARKTLRAELVRRFPEWTPATKNDGGPAEGAR